MDKSVAPFEWREIECRDHVFCVRFVEFALILSHLLGGVELTIRRLFWRPGKWPGQMVYVLEVSGI